MGRRAERRRLLLGFDPRITNRLDFRQGLTSIQKEAAIKKGFSPVIF